MITHPSRRPPLPGALRLSGAAVALSALVALSVLAGCGGASSSSSTSTAANSAAAGGPDGARRGRVRACLQAHGVTVPQRPPGSAPPAGAGGGLFGGGGGGGRFNDPAFRQAAAACGLQPGRLGQRSPQFRAQLGKFVTCVRQHGFNLPAPNTSGSGPVFDPAKVNRNDPRLLKAARACQALIPRRGGPGGSAGGSGSPPPGAPSP